MARETARGNGIHRRRRGCRAGAPVRGAAVRGAAVALTALALLLSGCAAAGGPAGPKRTPSAGPSSHEYRPGLKAFPHLPSGVTQAPVVVIIPGGAWASADPTGLEPLAAALAAKGVVAMPVVIRAEEDGVVHPVPVEDVLCALADGAATAKAAGIRPTRLVLLGHSSGAHLSALATLAPDAFSPTCEDPLVQPDAVVGLAGPYDIRKFADPATNLLGPDADPAVWDAANPVLLASRRPSVPVLLLHGADDELVPVTFSEEFAAALRAGGHPTTLEVLPGVNHGEVYAADVAGPKVLAWLTGLPASQH